MQNSTPPSNERLQVARVPRPVAMQAELIICSLGEEPVKIAKDVSSESFRRSLRKACKQKVRIDSSHKALLQSNFTTCGTTGSDQLQCWKQSDTYVFQRFSPFNFITATINILIQNKAGKIVSSA